MVDSDLAELFGVKTFRLNEQVKRNIHRFPEDFMFQLTTEEKQEVNLGCDHLGKLRFSRTNPYAFAEEGVAQLSAVLNSERAIKVNIQIIRMFTRMRSFVLSNKDILSKLDDTERQYHDHDKKIEAIFNYLKKLKSADQVLSDFRTGIELEINPR